ncbi:MAG: hypothetical protein LBP53_08985 [Candidatus Peribacteria bacterium]|jgi:hypothetical protein|nr:hypothetical protein [Candidatus Peribacteria bacterium]
MKKVFSKQRNVFFLFCPSPITIDKSSEWGPGNFQNAPDGAFLKVNEEEELSVSHLVQPNKEKKAPIGWSKVGPNLFDKVPIWVDEELLPIGKIISIKTKDGVMDYYVKEAAYRCYNEKAGEADLDDCWVQTERELKKNYEF